MTEEGRLMRRAGRLFWSVLALSVLNAALVFGEVWRWSGVTGGALFVLGLWAFANGGDLERARRRAREAGR